MQNDESEHEPFHVSTFRANVWDSLSASTLSSSSYVYLENVHKFKSSESKARNLEFGIEQINVEECKHFSFG